VLVLEVGVPVAHHAASAVAAVELLVDTLERAVLGLGFFDVGHAALGQVLFPLGLLHGDVSRGGACRHATHIHWPQEARQHVRC